MYLLSGEHLWGKLILQSREQLHKYLCDNQQWHPRSYIRTDFMCSVKVCWCHVALQVRVAWCTNHLHLRNCRIYTWHKKHIWFFNKPCKNNIKYIIMYIFKNKRPKTRSPKVAQCGWFKDFGWVGCLFVLFCFLTWLVHEDTRYNSL